MRYTIDIFLGGRFYGTLKMRYLGGILFPLSEEELREEIEKRLPYLAGKEYRIML